MKSEEIPVNTGFWHGIQSTAVSVSVLRDLLLWIQSTALSVSVLRDLLLWKLLRDHFAGGGGSDALRDLLVELDSSSCTSKISLRFTPVPSLEVVLAADSSEAPPSVFDSVRGSKPKLDSSVRIEA